MRLQDRVETAAVPDSNQSRFGLLRSGGGTRRPEAHGGGLVRAVWRHHASQRPSTIAVRVAEVNLKSSRNGQDREAPGSKETACGRP